MTTTQISSSHGTTYPPRTVYDETGDWSGVILSVPDFQTFLRLLAQHADWETLPPYLQDAVDNYLADEAEAEVGIPSSSSSRYTGTVLPSKSNTGLPSRVVMSSRVRDIPRSMYCRGTTYMRPDVRTMTPRALDIETGSSILNFVPRPGCVDSNTSPPSAETFSLTTDNPIPRPESSVTVFAVERPL